MSERRSMDSSCLRRRTLSRARVCALLLLAGLWSAGARAQMCGTTYISPTQAGANTVLTEVDTSSNPWVYIPIGTASVQYNAMAYDPSTDTLYAMQSTTTTLLSIDAMDEIGRAHV